MTQPLATTRMELLVRRSQLKLARQGRDLLEQKRVALMQELLKVVNVVIEESAELESLIADARLAMGEAEALAGAETVRAATFAMRDEFALDIHTARLMGVEVPQIEQREVRRSVFGRGYNLVTTSTAIDEAALAFETVVETVIQQAERELRLKRLAEEIQRTSRRLNALDHIRIPRLEREINAIEMALNERERADHYRFRLAKRILARKRGLEQ